MKIHSNIEQGTDEWFDIRKLKLTASHAQAIAAQGAGLETLTTELVAEYYSTAPKEHFSNEHTERGNELESIAVAMFEVETGKDTEIVGFVEIDENTGFSPDRFVEDDELLEIKCPNDTGYTKHLLNGDKEIDKKYWWQCQMQLLLSGRKVNYLTYYNPNFKKNIIIYPIYPDQYAFEKLRAGIEMGKNQIKQKVEIIKNQFINNNQ